MKDLVQYYFNTIVPQLKSNNSILFYNDVTSYTRGMGKLYLQPEYINNFSEFVQFLYSRKLLVYVSVGSDGLGSVLNLSSKHKQSQLLPWYKDALELSYYDLINKYPECFI